MTSAIVIPFSLKRPSVYRALVRAVTPVIGWIRDLPLRLTENRPMFLLVLFIFFWKFSPSVGYIERSYLIDVRGFSPATFGIILSAGSLTFLVSILAYRWVVRRFRGLALAGGGT